MRKKKNINKKESENVTEFTFVKTFSANIYDEDLLLSTAKINPRYRRYM